MKLFTLGYENRNVLGLYDILKEQYIEVLLDVRNSPYSSHRGFSIGELQAAFRRKGLLYISKRNLGTPLWIRQKMKYSRDYDWFRTEFMHHIKSQTEALQEIATMIPEQTVCLFCYEHDYRHCHRSFLAERFAEMLPGLEVIHL